MRTHGILMTLLMLFMMASASTAGQYDEKCIEICQGHPNLALCNSCCPMELKFYMEPCNDNREGCMFYCTPMHARSQAECYDKCFERFAYCADEAEKTVKAVCNPQKK